MKRKIYALALSALMFAICALALGALMVTLVGCGNTVSVSVEPNTAEPETVNESTTTNEPDTIDESTVATIDESATAETISADYNPADAFTGEIVDVEITVAENDVVHYDPELYSEYYSGDRIAFDLDQFMLDLGYRIDGNSYIYDTDNYTLYVYFGGTTELYFGFEDSNGGNEFLYAIYLVLGPRDHGTINLNALGASYEIVTENIAPICTLAQKSRLTRDSLRNSYVYTRAGIGIYSPNSGFGGKITSDSIDVYPISSGYSVTGPAWYLER